jgi:hypothetical protein
MNDQELIEYCELHCHTERALFHKAHVRRMFELAGDKKVLERFDALTLPDWVAVHAEAMVPLAHAARRAAQKRGKHETRRQV